MEPWRCSGPALKGLAGFCSRFCSQGLFAPASLGAHIRNDRGGSASILPDPQCWHRRGCCCWGLFLGGAVAFGAVVNVWGSLFLGGWWLSGPGHCFGADHCLGVSLLFRQQLLFLGAVAAVGRFWLVFSFSLTKAPLSPSDWWGRARPGARMRVQQGGSAGVGPAAQIHEWL